VIVLLSLLLAYSGAAKAPGSEPLEAPVVSATLGLRQEANGQCSEVAVGLKGQPPLIQMRDICHGWSTQSCATILLIKAQGVMEDAAQVLFLRDNRSADLVTLVDAEIGRVWPGNEHLHLSLNGIRCEGGGMAIDFVGSRVPKAVSASAHGIAGTVTLTSPDQIAVRISPKR